MCVPAPTLVVMNISSPLPDEVAKVCAPTEPLSEVTVPEAPASVPQENCPVVVLYRSFCVVRSQATSPAPLILFAK